MPKYGVREICDVVLKAKAAQKIGNKIFYAGEPVIYFDTLKTSSLEGAATTVYAQGGRGNPRLMSWDGERTVTFTMEDALISPEGFMILSGAGLVDAKPGAPIYQHVTETIDKFNVDTKEEGTVKIVLTEKPFLNVAGENGEAPKELGDYAYVMFMKDGEIITEPYIPEHAEPAEVDGGYQIVVKGHANNNPANEGETDHADYTVSDIPTDFDSVLVDYYVAREANAQQIEITADKFGGNYYLEASTLFRDQNGVDQPAEFIIPNCRIQSNFTFTMASSGDPSTFTFTMDAFPDYTRFDHSKKVLAALQIIQNASAQNLHRHSTVHEEAHDKLLWD